MPRSYAYLSGLRLRSSCLGRHSRASFQNGGLENRCGDRMSIIQSSQSGLMSMSQNFEPRRRPTERKSCDHESRQGLGCLLKKKKLKKTKTYNRRDSQMVTHSVRILPNGSISSAKRKHGSDHAPGRTAAVNLGSYLYPRQND